jgi:predicted phage terminase large subunit-like protein
MLAVEDVVKKQIAGNILQELQRRELARRHLATFTQYTFPNYQMTSIHQNYAQILTMFARGEIKKLIVSMGPQHGKSELSTLRLPAFMLGHNPNLKIAIACYSLTHARKFSVAIQRLLADPLYHNLFPDTTISNNSFSQKSKTGINYAKTKELFEIINYLGELKAVGRGGALTGNPVDIMLMDDLYKDYSEGNSPVIRETVIDWYTSVVRTRLHNDSQQLIVFTRWHEEDLVGFLENSIDEEVILLTKKEQLLNIELDCWYKINFPSLATEASKENEFDLRAKGTPLWPKRHSQKKLENDRKLDEEKFESLHQGDPKPSKGLLYYGFNTYITKPKYRMKKNYTDVADKGKDKLCSICYEVGIDDMIYITDIYFTSDAQEITEPETATMLDRNQTQEAYIESNNGGRGFARNVNRECKKFHTIKPFYQGNNKESRIISQSAEVQRKILFPINWTTRWPEFAKDILRFKRNFKANTHDDAEDALTGVLEFSGLTENIKNALWDM